MGFRNRARQNFNFALAGATLVCGMLGSGCAAEAGAPDGEQVDVDVAALGVESVVRHAAGEYALIGAHGTEIGAVSVQITPEGTTLSATVGEAAGSLGWSGDALSGGCGDQFALLAVRGGPGGDWAEAEGAEHVSLEACGDALKVAAIVAEAEGVALPLAPGLQPEPSASEPSSAPQMMQCGGGTNWVWGGSCSRCLNQMKMIVGASGTITIACDPGYTWTACSWSSC